MKAKLCANQLQIGRSAWEFIRWVENSHMPVKDADNPEKAEALEILESCEETMKPPEEDIDLGVITVETVNRVLSDDLMDFKLLPYFFTNAAKDRGEGVFEGSYVTLLGDDRIFEVLRISYEQESVRIRDDHENEFIVPWGLIRPCKEEE